VSELLRWIRRLFVGLVLLTIVGIVAVALRPGVAPEPLLANQGTPRGARAPRDGGALDSTLAAIRFAAPFQPTRTPAAPFSAASTPPPSQIPRPTLVLTALAGGRDPSAVLEGLPGVEGARVVRVGDTIGGVRIRSIRVGRVVVTGLDTLWSLMLREP